MIVTAKDNTQRLAKALEDVIITEDDGSQYCMGRKHLNQNMISLIQNMLFQKQMKLILS